MAGALAASLPVDRAVWLRAGSDGRRLTSAATSVAFTARDATTRIQMSRFIGWGGLSVRYYIPRPDSAVFRHDLL
jgi:hypothetical protein